MDEWRFTRNQKEGVYRTMTMHDYIINSYNVDIKNKTVEIYAEDADEKYLARFTATGVLTHSFQAILDYNIILDIEERDVRDFIEGNIEELNKMKKYNWPIYYRDIQELKEYLLVNGYKYIMIASSFGMSGWILAKKYEITQYDKV